MKTVIDIYNEYHYDESVLIGLTVQCPGKCYGKIERIIKTDEVFHALIDGDYFFDSWPSNRRRGTFPVEELEVISINGILHINYEASRNFCGHWDQDFKLFKGYVVGVGAVVIETGYHEYEDSLKKFVRQALRLK